MAAPGPAGIVAQRQHELTVRTVYGAEGREETGAAKASAAGNQLDRNFLARFTGKGVAVAFVLFADFVDRIHVQRQRALGDRALGAEREVGHDDCRLRCCRLRLGGRLFQCRRGCHDYDDLFGHRFDHDLRLAVDRDQDAGDKGDHDQSSRHQEFARSASRRGDRGFGDGAIDQHGRLNRRHLVLFVEIASRFVFGFVHLIQGRLRHQTLVHAMGAARVITAAF